ncbi:unnamed protein product [Durusdinium trenchii]|uniref:Uncharacterized protein n=2 Tax=Durusdinium trenchii TaxID=1381693 RepID=A0ABP0S0R2_9DINO
MRIEAVARLSANELVELARTRAYLTSYRKVPAAPKLANALQGELEVRHLSLQQATSLLHASLQLVPDAARRDWQGSKMLQDLAEETVKGQDAAAAAALLQSHALIYGNKEASKSPLPVQSLCLRLAPLAFRGESMPDVPLKALETLEVTLPQSLQQVAVHHVQQSIKAAGPGFGQALAMLWQQGVVMEPLFRRIAAHLVPLIFWWRHSVQMEKAEASLSSSMRSLMFTQIVENRAVWDVGLVQEVQKKIDQEFAQGLQAEELERMLRMMLFLANLRVVRPPMWRSFMSSLMNSMRHMPKLKVQLSGLPSLILLLDLTRRTPFPALVPKDLLHEVAVCAGPAISSATPEELAKLLAGFQRTSPAIFEEVLLRHHHPLLRARLVEEPMILCALAEGGNSSHQRPRWWRGEVLRPWARQLRRLVAVLRGGWSQARAPYEEQLRQWQVGDLGHFWQHLVLEAIGVAKASPAFARKGARAVLRHRRRTDASSAWAVRALGFVTWNLEQDGRKMEGSKLVFTATRGMNAEAQAHQLLSVDLGFLDRLYRRHGDVERVALLEMLDLLGERSATGSVELFVDRPICLSCLGVLAQFHRQRPELEVRVASFGSAFFPRPPSKQRSSGVLRDEALHTSLKEG